MWLSRRRNKYIVPDAKVLGRDIPFEVHQELIVMQDNIDEILLLESTEINK
jgi:hypothetical protein